MFAQPHHKARNPYPSMAKMAQIKTWQASIVQEEEKVGYPIPGLISVHNTSDEDQQRHKNSARRQHSQDEDDPKDDPGIATRVERSRG
jgi:hypothetical protein